jgi:hypothetical protein
MNETILSILPGSDEQHRVVVALRHDEMGNSQMQLRQESWSQAVGWFAQSVVALAPDQIAALRGVLGTGGPCMGAKSPRHVRGTETGSPGPRILRIGA